MVRPLLAASILAATLLAPRAAWALDGDSAQCADGSEAISALVANLANVSPQDALPLDDSGNVPWCVTPDDPRCSPMDGGHSPTQTTAQAKLALGTVASLRSHAGMEPRPWQLSAAEDAARPGAYLRVERPPR